jgi:hypothetical protein
LRQDLGIEIQKNRDSIAENRLHIAILEEKVGINKKIQPLKTGER